MIPDEDSCPVSDSLLGRLYRSRPEGLAVLVKTVPPQLRAELAVYCYRRAHLQSIGLAIASSCTANHLYFYAGLAGLELHKRAAEAAAPDPIQPRTV